MHAILNAEAGPVLQRAVVLTEVVTWRAANRPVLAIVVRSVLAVIPKKQDTCGAHQIFQIEHCVSGTVPVMHDARIGRKSRRVLLCNPVQAELVSRYLVCSPLLCRVVQ